VTIPVACVGDITGHLAAIRGRIVGNDALPGQRCRVLAHVPLAELDEYQAALKSLTGGEGTFVVEHDHYSPAPPAVQAALIETFRPHVED
jgi:elongation factor G